MPDDSTESIDTAVFFRALHQRLHADTDRQDWLIKCRMTNDFINPCFMHTLHTITHGAYAREDNFIGLSNQFRVIGHIDCCTNMLKRFCC